MVYSFFFVAFLSVFFFPSPFLSSSFLFLLQNKHRSTTSRACLQRTLEICSERFKLDTCYIICYIILYNVCWCQCCTFMSIMGRWCRWWMDGSELICINLLYPSCISQWIIYSLILLLYILTYIEKLYLNIFSFFIFFSLMVGHISYRKRFYVPSNVYLFLQWVMSLHCHVVHEVNGMRRCNDYVMVLSYVQKLLIGYKCFLQVSSWWKEKRKKKLRTRKNYCLYIYMSNLTELL